MIEIEQEIATTEAEDLYLDEMFEEIQSLSTLEEDQNGQDEVKKPNFVRFFDSSFTSDLADLAGCDGIEISFNAYLTYWSKSGFAHAARAERLRDICYSSDEDDYVEYGFHTRLLRTFDDWAAADLRWHRNSNPDVPSWLTVTFPEDVQDLIGAAGMDLPVRTLLSCLAEDEATDSFSAKYVCDLAYSSENALRLEPKFVGVINRTAEEEAAALVRWNETYPDDASRAAHWRAELDLATIA